jgi:predicted GH43/DUF377 family glycosyl hydrolase
MKYLKFFVLIITIVFNSFAHSKVIDLEEHTDNFILETKQINLKNYLLAFNPSIIRYKNAILMVFRIRDPLLKTTNEMGIIRLGSDLSPASKVYRVKIKPCAIQGNNQAQDPKLIVIKKELYLVYNDNTSKSSYLDVRRMVVAKLEFNGQDFVIEKSNMITTYDHEIKNRNEKNWVPFIYQHELHLAYSLKPHSIFNAVFHENRCESVSSTNNYFDWAYGELRGGTQCFLVDNEYLGFFHSCITMATKQSNNKAMPHYFMGAYTFEPEPPFSITSISREPIIGKNFYNGVTHNTWKPLRVVFPGGFVFDENYIWVSYGRQDHEMWIVKMDKKKLLKSLKRK